MTQTKFLHLSHTENNHYQNIAVVSQLLLPRLTPSLTERHGDMECLIQITNVPENTQNFFCLLKYYARVFSRSLSGPRSLSFLVLTNIFTVWC